MWTHRKLKFSQGYIGSLNTRSWDDCGQDERKTKKFKHVGIKFDCGQCDYKGAEHSKL